MIRALRVDSPSYLIRALRVDGQSYFIRALRVESRVEWVESLSKPPEAFCRLLSGILGGSPHGILECDWFLRGAGRHLEKWQLEVQNFNHRPREGTAEKKVGSNRG